MTTKSEERDYLAYTPIMGGGSWARGSDLEEQVKRCAGFVHSDWGSVYDLDGKTVEIGVYDVTGFDKLRMSGGEVYVHDDDKPMGRGENIAPLEIREVTLPKSR